MKAIFLLAFKNLTSRPGRSFSCALGIALGLAVVMAVITVDRNTLLTQRTLRSLPYGEPDVEIRPKRPVPGAAQGARRRLESEKGLREIAALFFQACTVRTVRGKSADLPVAALDRRAAAGFHAYRVQQGSDLSFEDAPELLLSPKAAKRLGVAPGDAVRVRAALPVRRVCRDGKLLPRPAKRNGAPPSELDFRVQGILAEEHLGLGFRAVMSFDQGLRLFEGLYVLPLFWARLAPGTDLDTLRARLRDGFTVEKPFEEALVGESPEEKAFRNGVRACAVLSLLLGLFIIFNAMSMSLVERIRQIGLLRALGLTRGGLTLLFLAEGFLLTAAGGILSVGLTAGIVYFLKVNRITTLGFGRPLEILEIPWTDLAGVLLLGTVFALLGAIHPVGKAARLSVIQALRRGAVAFESRPLRGAGRHLFLLYVLLLPAAYLLMTPVLTGRYLDLFLLVFNAGVIAAAVMALLLFFPPLLRLGAVLLLRPFTALFPVTGRVARWAVGASRFRLFSTVSGLTLVSAAILVIASVTASLRSETEAFADRALSRTLFVRAGKPGAISTQALQNAAGSEAVVFNLTGSIRAPFPVRGMDANKLARLPAFQDRPDVVEALATGKGILLSPRLAKSYGYRTGDTVRLSTPEAGMQEFTVAEITDAVGFYPDDRSFAVLGQGMLTACFCVSPDPGLRWAILLPEGRDPSELAARLEARLGDCGRVISGPALRTEYLEDLDRNFAIFKVIAALVALLSGVSILNSLWIAVMERRRETALFRVVGLTPGQLKGMLFLEAYTMGALGGFFGLLLGVPVSWIAVTGLRRIAYLELTPVFPPLLLAAVFLGTVLLSLAASILPAFRQSGPDMMEAVKYE